MALTLRSYFFNEKDYALSILRVKARLFYKRYVMATAILQLDVKVTEDFINGKASSNGPTRSTGTHLFLNDYLIARRDPDGQVYAVRKGMNAEAETLLKNFDYRT